MNAEIGVSGPWSSFCGNCSVVLENTANKSEVIYKGSPDEVKIIDAIAYVYGITSEEILSLLEKTYLNKTGEEVRYLHLSTKSIFLCESCKELLSYNYVAHKRFENASSPSSVAHVINSSRRNPKEVDIEICYENEVEQNEDLDLDSNDSTDNDEIETETNNVVEIDLTGEDENETALQTVNNETIRKNFISKLNANDSKLYRQLTVRLERLSEADFSKHFQSFRQNQALPAKRLRRPPAKLMEVESEASKNGKKWECGKCYKRFMTKSYLVQFHLPNCKKMTVTPKDVPKSIPKDVSKDVLKDVPKEVPKDVPKEIPKTAPKDMPKITPKNISKGRLNRNRVNTHIVVVDKEKGHYYCEKCEKPLLCHETASHNRKFHPPPLKNFQCEICDKRFSSNRYLKQHRFIHSADFTPFICSHCGKSFDTYYKLEGHQRFHLSVHKHFCDICSYSSVTKTAMTRHKFTHATERQFVCEECGKAFKMEQTLQCHLLKHKDAAEVEKGRIFDCDECGIVLKNSGSVYKHKAEYHPADRKRKIHECSICGRLLKCTATLREHLKLHKIKPDFKPRKNKIVLDKETPVNDTSGGESGKEEIIAETKEGVNEQHEEVVENSENYQEEYVEVQNVDARDIEFESVDVEYVIVDVRSE